MGYVPVHTVVVVLVMGEHLVEAVLRDCHTSARRSSACRHCLDRS